MNAAHLAEQATLGALLLTDQAVPAVAGWLRGEDFTDPWHRSVYRAILDEHAAGRGLDAARLAVVLVDWLGPRAADLPRIHDLLAATPIAPQPVAYARMVLATAIRERTAAYGVLLRAGALAVATTGDGRRLTGALDLVTAAVTDDQTRWTTAATTSTTGESVVVASGGGLAAAPPGHGWRDAALGADRALTDHDLDPAEVRDHERTLITAVAAHPHQLPAVRAWLRVACLTDPEWRPVYAALLELDRAGTGIDPVTVAWQVHTGTPRYGPGPGTRAIRDGLDAATVVDVDHAARRVGVDLLRRYADHATVTLRAASTNPGVTVDDVLGTARLMTTTLAGLADTLPDLTTRHAPDRTLQSSRAIPTRRPGLSLVR